MSNDIDLSNYTHHNPTVRKVIEEKKIDGWKLTVGYDSSMYLWMGTFRKSNLVVLVEVEFGTVREVAKRDLAPCNFLRA